jgi:hypothetical protein
MNPRLLTRLFIVAAFCAILGTFFRVGLAASALVAITIGVLSIRRADLPAHMQGSFCDATLIVPILTGKVFEAFKSKPVGLDFISTDFGKSGSGFAQPAKFGQEVISQLASVPTVSRTTPGGLLTTGISAKTLVTDLRVSIDRMAAVKVRLPSQDIEQLMAMPAFLQSLAESGMALGRFVLNDAISEAISGRNFTNRIIAAAPDLDTLESARAQLNLQQALEPRFCLGTTAFLGKIGADPRVLQSWGYNQRLGADPYAQFDNMKGFTTVKELAAFPTGNRTLATVTASDTTDLLTVAALASGLDPLFDLYNGARVRVTSTGNIPAGLAADTDYFVRDLTQDGTNGVVTGSGVGNTFKLAATLGGVAINLTDAGTGTITISQLENAQGLAFEKRAIHIATRPMIDPVEAARQMGIPSAMITQRETDPATGLDILTFIYQDISGANPTLDIYAAFVVQYGIRAGRGIQSVTADPTSFAANTGMDRAGLRIITA